MDYNDVIIHIDIQASALIGIDIRELVRETFAYMPPWKMVGNAIFAPSDSRFFAFNLTTYDFIWHRNNESYDDTMDEENTFIIHNTAEMSWLLEFIALNQATFRKHHGLNLEKLKQKLEEYDKLANPSKKKRPPKKPSFWPSASPSLAEIMKVQPMAVPSGKVFYMDYVNTWANPPQGIIPDEVIAKLKAEAGKEIVGSVLSTPVTAKPKKLKAKWAPESDPQFPSEDVIHQMAEELKNEIDKEILAKMLQTVPLSWGAQAEFEYCAKAKEAAWQKAHPKYAYKPFNPEYYGKIVINSDPPTPMDF